MRKSHFNYTIVSHLNNEQLETVKKNPELDKKLRVDRLKKLAFFDPTAPYKPQQSSLEDP